MTWFAVDIDDTLYSFSDLARAVFVQVALEHGDKRCQRGAYHPWTEWRSPADATDDDLWPQVIARCHTAENILAQAPFPHAVETLTELADQGDYLHYISNRQPESRAATEEWLRSHGFPLRAGFRLTCNTGDKIAQVRDCQYIIDDRPKTLVQFVYDFMWMYWHGSKNPEKTREGFGLHRPHNLALTDVPGVTLAPNWQLLRQYIMDRSTPSTNM